jgi:hypothetical protein
MGAARALAAAAVVGSTWYVLGGQGADGELLYISLYLLYISLYLGGQGADGELLQPRPQP